jgi:hypothetical protein
MHREKRTMPRLLLKWTGYTHDRTIYRAAEATEVAACAYYGVAQDVLRTGLSLEVRALAAAAIWFVYSDFVDGMVYAA